MKTYSVEFLARESGAIGKFYPVGRTILADTKDEAKSKVFTLLHEEGYETLHGHKTIEITTSSCD